MYTKIVKRPSRLSQTILLLIIFPLLVVAVKKILDTRKGAAGLPADIIVDVTSPQTKVPSSLWRNFSQGGEEPRDMIAPVINQVANLQPELIRIDHLFDYYQVYQSPGVYNFSQLDQVINSVLQTGALPMLSLSYTPASMTKNNQNAGEPANWNDWYQLVRATAHRYSVEKNISSIYYEVWNEPDLFGGWHYAKSPSYTTLYIQTAKAIVDGAARSNYKIGGPATTGFYSSWIKSLFATASQNHLPLDFISWHRYSKNPADYEKDFDSLNKILGSYPNYFNIERVITEIGPNSEPDSWYDNHLSGIHLISLASQLSGKIHRLFTFELVDGPTSRSPEKSSGWGLITHHTNGSQIKPRYQAIQFLNQLQGQSLPVQGNGSWVTALATANSGSFQVLLVNYDPKNIHPETVPVTFKGIKPGTYQLKTTRFLGNTSTKTIETLSYRWYETIYLDPNSAALLELTPTF